MFFFSRQKRTKRRPERRLVCGLLGRRRVNVLRQVSESIPSELSYTEHQFIAGWKWNVAVFAVRQFGWTTHRYEWSHLTSKNLLQLKMCLLYRTRRWKTRQRSIVKWIENNSENLLGIVLSVRAESTYPRNGADIKHCVLRNYNQVSVSSQSFLSISVSRIFHVITKKTSNFQSHVIGDYSFEIGSDVQRSLQRRQCIHQRCSIDLQKCLLILSSELIAQLFNLSASANALHIWHYISLPLQEDSKVYANIHYLDGFFEQQLGKWLPQYSGASNNNSTNMGNIADEPDIYSGTSAKRMRTDEDVSLVQ